MNLTAHRQIKDGQAKDQRPLRNDRSVCSDNRLSRYVSQLSIDAGSGLLAGLAITPIVVVIDTAVTEAAFGRRTILPSLKHAAWDLLSRPHRVAVSKPFTAMLLLYSGTYFTANSCDTISSIANGLHPTTYNSSLTKLGIVSGVNMSLALYKENAFATTFGSASPSPASMNCGSATLPAIGPLRKTLPAASYLPFIVRDAITIFASFNIPHILSPELPENFETAYSSRLSVAQLIAPAASQIIVTPLHLLGLDLYNRRGRLSWQERWSAARKGWIGSSVARMARVIPGLALGNVINTKVRNGLIESITKT